MSFVNDYPRNIERYADKLYTVFPEETITIYEDYIKNSMKEASNRKRYWTICRIIEKFMTYTDVSRVRDLVQLFENTYPRRTAMLDELSKLHIR